ncbi:MAG: hypothetical protein ACI4LX_05110 [Treponema sp.]
MKHCRNFLKALAALVLLPFFSCAGMPENKIDSVYVMVYDQDGMPVMNASVFIDGKKAGQTDIYGRLSFPFGSEKETEVRAEKPGYETVSRKTVVKPGTVLYFKTGSGTYYAEKAESLLDKGNADDALKMADTALQIEERKDWLFLREVILESKKRRTEND